MCVPNLGGGFFEHSPLFCRSTEGAPRVSEAVRVEMPGDALLLVNERGEMVSRARDAVFPEGSNLEEANAALLRRMVEGKKLAVVEVPPSSSAFQYTSTRSAVFA